MHNRTSQCCIEPPNLIAWQVPSPFVARNQSPRRTKEFVTSQKSYSGIRITIHFAAILVIRHGFFGHDRCDWSRCDHCISNSQRSVAMNHTISPEHQLSFPGSSSEICAYTASTSGWPTSPVRTSRKTSMPGCGVRLQPIAPGSSLPSKNSAIGTTCPWRSGPNRVFNALHALMAAGVSLPTRFPSKHGRRRERAAAMKPSALSISAFIRLVPRFFGSGGKRCRHHNIRPCNDL